MVQSLARPRSRTVGADGKRFHVGWSERASNRAPSRYDSKEFPYLMAQTAGYARIGDLLLTRGLISDEQES